MDRTLSLVVYKDADDLSVHLADWISTLIMKTLKTASRFTIALSGGNTPKKLHLLLAAAPYRNKIDWNKLHIFWGDERAVPFTDDRNNAKMAFDTLLNGVPVPAEQIHVMRTDIPPEAAAAEYQSILEHYFGGNSDALPAQSFDLVLLGMGDDGHTLSLFPGMPVIHEEKKWVTAFFLPDQNMYRITLTRGIVNRSAQVAFMISGSGKAAALKEVLQGNLNPDLYPSQVIKPVDGKLEFFVDEDAAAQLRP